MSKQAEREAPVRPTCGSIDSVIIALKEAGRCIDLMEELREANEKLRVWGVELQDRVWELESEITRLERELEKAEASR